MSPSSPPPAPQLVASHSSLQTLVAVTGALFLAVGLGVVPGMGIHYGQLGFAGAVCHGGFGVTGLLAGCTAARAQSFLILGGSLSLVLFFTGCVLAYAVKDDVFVEASWIRLGVGVAMITLGVVQGRTPHREQNLVVGHDALPDDRPTQ